MAAQFDPGKRIYGIMYASITAVFWGFLAIFIKVTLNDVSPVIIVWFRFAVAFSFLFSYFLFRDRPKLAIIKKPPFLIVLGAIALTVNYIGFATGIYLTSPNNAQVFIQIGPITLALAGIFIFKESITKRQLLGFIVAAAGLTLFYRDQIRQLLGEEDVYVTGVLWLVLAALSWATYAALQKKMVQKYHAQQLNLIVFGLPIILLLPWVDFSTFAQFTPGLWVLLIFLGINTIVAYGCLSEAFRYIEANKISVIITLNPIITFVVMSILSTMDVSWIDAKAMTFYGAIGALLVISGAVLVVLAKKRKQI